MNDYVMIKPNELYHHGILGQKWGIRRYQNADGTLTEAGRKRVNVQKYRMSKDQYEKHLNKRLDEAKTKEDKTKIIREEQRDLAEGFQRHNAFKNLRAGIAGITGGISGAVAGLIATSSIAIPGPAITGAILSAIAGVWGYNIGLLGETAVESIGQKYIYDERNSAKSNLLNTKYDDLNIDENTKRRLNL